MAIFHFSVQIIGRSAGRSATGAAAYRAGEFVTDERTEEVHDYSRKSGVVNTQIFAPTDAPAWVHNRSDLWNKVEKTEKRKDSQLCREINLALPAELSSRQRMDLIHEYVKRNFVSVGMVADVCIHAPSRTENNQNHHAHVMLTMRRLDGDGFGPKETSWNAVELLENWRKNWAQAANAALEAAGFEDRVDHRSHAARGIEDEPGQHHGPAVAGILARGEYSDVAERQAGESAARVAAKLAAQLVIARAQATAAFEELAAAEAAAQVVADAKARKERAAAEAAAQAAAREQQALAQVQAEVVAQAVAREQAAATERAQVAQTEAAAQAAAREQQALAQVQAEVVARAMAYVLARQEQAEADRAQALTQARTQHAAAQAALATAVQAEVQAEACADALRPARDAAVDGQRQAGTGLFKTAKAVLKVPIWMRAIDAYDSAMEVLKSASAAVQRARQVVADLWTWVLQLDPEVERNRQATVRAAQMEARTQTQRGELEMLARREAERFTKPGQRPDSPRETPPHEHSRELDRDRDKDRERGG